VSTVVCLESSIVVAGLLTWHEAHERAFSALQEALEAEDPVVLPLRALLEAYAVMTRLPPPHRLSGQDAFRLLSESLRPHVRVVRLRSSDAWRFLQELAENAIAGGSTYDAAVLASARRAGASVIVTLNPRHFKRLVSDEFEIRVP
jgi:predicted nucleic acid-binding protein